MQTWWRCQCVHHSSVCLPDKDAGNPTVAPITFLPLSRRLDHQQHHEAQEITVQMASHWALTFVQQRDSEPVTTTADKGHWDGIPQGSIFAPLTNACVSESPTANFPFQFERKTNGAELIVNYDTLRETKQIFNKGLVLIFKIFLS